MSEEPELMSLALQFIGPMHCGSIWHWGDITQKGTCQRWKADVAFSFLSFIFWLASALVVSLLPTYPYLDASVDAYKGIYFIYTRRTTNIDSTRA